MASLAAAHGLRLRFRTADSPVRPRAAALLRSWRNQVDAPARGAGGPRGLSRFKSGRAHEVGTGKGSIGRLL
jgi:hypothetical protein